MAKIYVYGDNVDTDVIIAARYLNDPDERNLAAHCMEDIDPDSSREHAPLAIKASGVKCVIAASFARIFYRNAINIGFPIMECPEAAAHIKPGDQVSVDFKSGKITDETTGEVFQAAPFPEFIEGIIEHGGLMNSLKARGLAK